MNSKSPLLSIVIPVRNERENIRPLFSEIAGSLNNIDYELIFVDDGSEDGTFDELQAVFEEAPAVKVIRFARNFGKSAAYSAGFEHAAGEIVATMDGDLQDSPSDLPRMIEKLNEGFDLVVGWKRTGKSSFATWIASAFFNRIIMRLTGLELNDINCPLRVMRRHVATDLRPRGGQYRFIPYMVANQGFTVCQIEVGNRPRQHGKSKYSARKYLASGFDLMTVLFLNRFSERPLYAFGALGLVCFLLGAILEGYVFWQLFIFDQALNTVLLKVLVGMLVIIFGSLLFAIGLLGEMIFQASASADGRRHFVVSTILSRTSKSTHD